MRPGRTIEKRQPWPGLRGARVRAGLSLTEASEGLCSPSTLWAWEKDNCKPPRFAVRQLAKRYGVKMRSMERAQTR